MAGEGITSKADIKTEGDGIREALSRVFKELTEIRVVTAVTDVKVVLRTSADGTVETTMRDTETETKALITVFDLIDGDVTTVISPALRDDESLRAFHSAQVEKSLKVLPDHVRALVDVGQKIFQM